MPKRRVFTGRVVPVTNLIFIPPVVASELKTAAKKGQGTEFFKKFRLGDLIVFRQPKVCYDEGLRILNECRH
jgi:hypothetical protein